MHRKLWLSVAVLAAGVLAGCTTETTTSGNDLIIRFDATTRAFVIAVPAVLIGIALVLVFFRRTRPAGLLGVAAIGGLTALIIPGVLQDTVTVTSEGVHQRTGFWFAPTHKGFRFADVSKVRIVKKRLPMRKRPEVIWELHDRAGEITDFDPGDLWENASPEILPRVKQAGVEVEPTL